jgi:ethanolamine ammonia-lyase small subunit
MKFGVCSPLNFQNPIKNNKVIHVLRLKKLGKARIKLTRQGENKKTDPFLRLLQQFKIYGGIVLRPLIVDFFLTFPNFLSLKTLITLLFLIGF